MNYNPQTFLYLDNETPCFYTFAEVPIEVETSMGRLELATSKQKLVYGRCSNEKVMGFYEFELIG